MSSETAALIILSLFFSTLPTFFLTLFITAKLDRIYIESLMSGNHKKLKIDSCNMTFNAIVLLSGLGFLVFAFSNDGSIPFKYEIVLYIFIIGAFGIGVHGILEWLAKINTIVLFQDVDYFVYTSHFFKVYEIKYSDINYVEFYVIGEGLKRFEVAGDVPLKYIKVSTKVKAFKLDLDMIGLRYFLDKLEEYDKVKFLDSENEEQL